MIPKLQVDLAEIFCTFELAQKVINPWDWVPIPDNDLVQRPIVNTESPRPIFLQKLLNLPLNFIILQNRAPID